MEVFHQRLDQEYGASIITTTPTVPYSLKHTDGTTEEIQNPSQVQPNPAMSCLWDIDCPGHPSLALLKLLRLCGTLDWRISQAEEIMYP